MAKNNSNIFIPTNYSVWSAPYGSTPPTSPSAAPSASFYEVGLLSDSGITEGREINQTNIFDLLGTQVAVARSQEQRPFGFQALEDNRVVRELRYPGSTLSTVAGTSEVQTGTITGTPTGGTFVLIGGYGGTGTTAPIAYNATGATVQTAVRTLPGFSLVTVSGSAGGPYTITFPVSTGDVAALTVDNSGLTGGTSPAVGIVTTTPGVPSVNTRHVGPGTSQNHRTWLVYLAKGTKHNLYVIYDGEAQQTGTITRVGAAASISEFQLTPYLDANTGVYFDLIDDDPAQAVAYA